MIDITVFKQNDLQIADTQSYKAGNVLSIQLGYLEYAQDFGIDLEYFLQPDFEFENSSFKSYLVQRLTASGINVVSVVEELETFYAAYVMNIASQPTTTALIK